MQCSIESYIYQQNDKTKRKLATRTTILNHKPIAQQRFSCSHANYAHMRAFACQQDKVVAYKDKFGDWHCSAIAALAADHAGFTSSAIKPRSGHRANQFFRF
jgi:hypothetical protein